MADARDEKVWTKHSEEMMNLPQFKDHSCGPITETIKELFPIGPVSVLDYGCGTAQWSSTFKDFQYHCYDQNKDMIAGAMQRMKALGIQPSGVYQSFWNELQIDKTFDVIFTSAVIQHNLHGQKDLVLKQILDLLKPGGVYICLENTLEPEKNAFQFPRGYAFTDETSDGYSFTRIGWERYFKEHKFENISDQFMKHWNQFKSDYYVLRKPL